MRRCVVRRAPARPVVRAAELRLALVWAEARGWLEGLVLRLDDEVVRGWVEGLVLRYDDEGVEDGDR